MTKKEMIEMIQKKEQELWSTMDMYETTMSAEKVVDGYIHDRTKKRYNDSLTEWCVVYRLMLDLGIAKE